MKIRALAITVAFGAALAANAASAQNVGNNAGMWWTPAAGQPAAFTFLNPLTSAYGRIGFQRAFGETPGASFIPPFIPPGIIAIDVPDSWGAHIGFGTRLMPVLRVELQLSGQFSVQGTAQVFGFVIPATTVRLSSTQLMGNLYLDVAPFFGNSLWGLNPYLFGGVGVSWNTNGEAVVTGTPLPGTGNTHTSFAWNAGAGVQWQPMRNVILDVGYRYLDAGHWQGAPTAGVPVAARFENTSHQVTFSVILPIDGLLRGFGN